MKALTANFGEATFLIPQAQMERRMANKQPDPSGDTISVEDMRGALKDEIREVMKAAELRVRALSEITTAYAAGELTPEQATDNYFRHMDKWGEAFPGVRSVIGKSDEELLAMQEKSAGPYVTREENRKRYDAPFGNLDRTGK
jgi:hypothetical protein